MRLRGSAPSLDWRHCIKRSFGDYEVSATIERSGNDPHQPIFWVRHAVKGLQRRFPLTHFAFPNGCDASAFARNHLDRVVSVNDDCTLRFL